MKKILHGMVLGALAFGVAYAETHIDKTFFMPKSHNPNLAMEYTTWHEQLQKKDEEKFGAHIQASLFYDKSVNKADVGKYFGITNNKNSSTLDGFIDMDDTSSTVHLDGFNVMRAYMSHSSSYYSAMSDKIVFNPYRESLGVRLDWHQRLDKLVDGLFFRVSAPIVNVKTSLGYSSTGSAATQTLPTSSEVSTAAGSDLSAVAPSTFTGSAKSLADYLTGNVANTNAATSQAALTHYKFHNGQSETGLADINVMLGYNFLYENKKYFTGNIALLIPTGTDPDGIYRFEPIVGNGGHWGLGAGFDGKFQLWSDDDRALDLSVVANYKYLFKGTEKRTMNFKYGTTTEYNATYERDLRAMWGPYMLGGQSGATEATPLANFLTQNVDVTPGSQIDAMLMLAYNFKHWTIDFGYELYAQEKEKVVVQSWTDDTYGVAHAKWNTNNAFLTATVPLETIYRGASEVTGSAAARSGYTIDNSHLLPGDAETPSKLMHKLFGGVGYAFSDWRYPLMAGLGGSYEFVSDNSALENWALWFKLGLTF
jgi:hypothetical protein